MQRILITGASGMLGSKVAEVIFKQKTSHVYGTGRTNIHPVYDYVTADLSNGKELDDLLASVKPDVIVHCAANVNLSDCEANKNDAYKINVEVSKQLASYQTGTCRLVYISTDAVFDGSKENFSESDTPSPLNYYAWSKLEGENAVIKTNINSLILRVNMYGLNQNKNGNSLFEWLYKNLSNGNSISGFTDVYFNPLHTGQLAEIIIQLINKNVTGILHLGCKEMISKYQFALLVAEAFDLDKSLIKADLSDVMQSTVKRPKNTTLNISALSNCIGKSYSIYEGINQLKSDLAKQKIIHG